MNNLLIILVFLFLAYLMLNANSETVEGFYYYTPYRPVRGYYRDYYPRVGTGISQYGLVPRRLSGFPHQGYTNYSTAFGPYRMPYLRNRWRYWNRVYRRPLWFFSPYRTPFYRVPYGTRY